jgi:hypothetical protein
LIWDNLFGTYQAEVPHVRIRYGLAHPRSSENPFVIAYEELWRMLKEVFSAQLARAGAQPDRAAGLTHDPAKSPCKWPWWPAEGRRQDRHRSRIVRFPSVRRCVGGRGPTLGVTTSFANRRAAEGSASH